MSVEIGNIDVGVFILGDSAFRLSRTLMKPYPFHVHYTAGQRAFNYNLSKCRRVFENAFGHLKARFRRIGKGIDNQIQNTNFIIKACCVLHNFLSVENDTVESSWLLEQSAIDRGRRHPHHSTDSEVDRDAAESIRDALCSYFSPATSEVDGLGIDANNTCDDNGEAGEI